MRGFMPLAENKFSDFANVFVEATEAFAALLGISAEKVTKVKALLTKYQTAYTACESPNAGPIDREDRRENRYALEGEIRRIKNAYIDGDPNGMVTNEVRMQFGLPPRDKSHTPIEPPRETPAFSLVSGGYLQITVIHPAKPINYNGAVLFYCISDEPLTSHEELTSSKLLTRMKETLAFKDTERLKTLSAALCWQNGKGQLGPMSPIQSIIIV
ncbi:MAG: hypothetical protein LBL06_04725 [Treponema sp.]|jgi:hypothetical protein|nr:hypothetical protein [Treponema sp.]